MTPLGITREELAWALTATLPHVGSKSRELDWIGLEADIYMNQLLVFATDGYSTGIAKAEAEAFGEEFGCYLTPKEARDLLAFVRPNLVAEKAEIVRLLTSESFHRDENGEVHIAELHVALEGPEKGQPEKSEPLSGVWSVRTPGNTFQAVYGLIEGVGRTVEPSGIVVLQPKLLAKFSRAQRDDDDVVNIYPARHLDRTAAVVTVGSGFIGAVAGIAASRHINQLPQWGLTERQEAA